MPLFMRSLSFKSKVKTLDPVLCNIFNYRDEGDGLLVHQCEWSALILRRLLRYTAQVQLVMTVTLDGRNHTLRSDSVNAISLCDYSFPLGTRLRSRESRRMD